VIAFAVMGAVILTIAFFFAYRPGLKYRTAFGAIAVGVLALVVGGAAAGLDGEREIHPHETTEGLSAEGEDICTSPEEFEADESASQSVAATAAVAATITLQENGQLTVAVNGPLEEGATALNLPRSNPNNVIFVNQSDEEPDETPRQAQEERDGEGGDDEEVPYLVCTTLVESDGRQNLTVTIGVPSLVAPDGYFFFVPGVESARLELIVP
jgi:hypothetical protein